MKCPRILTIALLMLIASTAVGFAQQTVTGEIQGKVSDKSGAVMPGVTVTLISADRSPLTAVTSETGSFLFPRLPIGTYSLKFELPGFKTVMVEAIRLTINQSATFDQVLEISTVQETVTVTGETPIVDTKDTGTQATFNREALQSLPTARDPWVILEQTPGITMDRANVGGVILSTKDETIQLRMRGDLFQGILGCRELVLYGFYDFIPVQKELLRNCFRRLEITVFMPWRESPGFAYGRPTLQWFKKSGFQIESLANPPLPAKTSLKFLQNDLFLEKPRGIPAPEDGRVTVLSSPGEVQEIREIAREILRLARDEGVKFHEMAVLLRNLELYRPLIQEVFQDLKIPFTLHGGLPLARTQEGRALNLLLGLIGTPFRRPQVMEFLTFAPVAWSRFFKDPPSSSRWDHIS
ncbi:MAG: hypothetical protein HGB17_13350, partial [Syntrophobacteraceae bacterium]|nr:hypothetical protein [Syntrophobacteraceae bacterium]